MTQNSNNMELGENIPLKNYSKGRDLATLGDSLRSLGSAY